MTKISEQSTWRGRPLAITWHDSSFQPPSERITQVSAFCFTETHEVVLVSMDHQHWQLVGGHPEAGETSEATLRREAAEEACARISHLVYLGCQEVNDPQNPEGMTTYYQVRFWAKVLLDEFRPQYEIVERTIVSISEVKRMLNWQTTGILDAMLNAALEQEQRFCADQANIRT